MRRPIFISLFFSVMCTEAQTVLPESLINYTGPGGFINSISPARGFSQKKWSFSKYTGISTTIAFFKGGNATIISAPMGLQLNRRLNNNWYAFANVAVAPRYTTINRAFLPFNYNKTGQKNGMFNSPCADIYSIASMGIMYVNENKTFSFSGSISVENNPYSALPYYPTHFAKPNHPVMSPKR